MAFRALAFFVLLWVVADLGDPAIPGVFSFASDRLFVDGVIQAKTAAPLAGTVDCLPPVAVASPSHPDQLAVRRPPRVAVCSPVPRLYRPQPPATTADIDRPDIDPLA